MAQYSTDFSEYTTDASPGDWSARWGIPSGITVREDSGDKYLRINGGNDEAASWDDIDSDGDRDDVEVLTRFRVTSTLTVTDPMGGIMVRGNADRDGYYVGPSSTSNLRLRKVVNSTESSIETVSTSFSAATWYWLRFRVNGTSLQARLWSGDVGDEPGTWDIDTSDSDVSAVGWVGVYLGSASVSPAEYDYFSVGTNGDAAPSPSGGDVTAPVLSSPTGTATGSTTATVGATTDEANGTQYAVVTVSGTAPSAAQIKAGQDNSGSAAAWSGSITISSAGANTHSATGLTASTAYYAHLIHTDAAANDSNIVTSAQFTTDAASGSAIAAISTYYRMMRLA